MRSLIGVLFLALTVQSLVLPEQLEKREQRTEIIYTNVAQGKETKQVHRCDCYTWQVLLMLLDLVNFTLQFTNIITAMI